MLKLLRARQLKIMVWISHPCQHDTGLLTSAISLLEGIHRGITVIYGQKSWMLTPLIGLRKMVAYCAPMAITLRTPFLGAVDPLIPCRCSVISVAEIQRSSLFSSGADLHNHLFILILWVSFAHENSQHIQKNSSAGGFDRCFYLRSASNRICPTRNSEFNCSLPAARW